MDSRWVQDDVALRHCQQNEALVTKVRQSFYQQHRHLLSGGNLTPSEAQQLAHSLKSTAPAIGAGPLSELANILAPPAPGPDESACQQLWKVLSETMVALQALLPDTGHGSLTKNLRSQLEQHNIGAIKLFTSWTEQEAAHWPAWYLDEVKTALAAFDFKTAKELFDNGTQRFEGNHFSNENDNISDP